ncbi:MAG: DNRLRE domain-containing protein [Spirochaetaceae bacterium]|nr:MAG: DNRLRE domain-containing protein [Spirochaetaceae bacterium]
MSRQVSLGCIVLAVVFFSGCNTGDPASTERDAPQQYVLREGLNNYSGTCDTMMNDGLPATNYGLSNSMWSGYWGNSPDEETTRSLLRFDLSLIPEDAEVVSATLRLVFNNVVAMASDYVITLEIFEADREWVETEATWQNASGTVVWDTSGGDYSGWVGLMNIPRPGYGSGDAIQISLDTAVVQRWVSNPADNRGMLFRNTSENTLDDSEKSYVVFYTKNFPTEAHRPRLTIEADLK